MRPSPPAPGPWHVEPSGHVYATAFCAPAPFVDTEGRRHDDYKTGLVALVYSVPCPSLEGPYYSASANARLIAAAPEMLAVLRHLAKQMCPLTFTGCAPDIERAKALVERIDGDQEAEP